MISISFIVLASALSALAIPAPVTAARNVTRRDDDVYCGTTQDADLAACQSILDNWSGTLVESNECHYGGFWDGSNTAWNVASVPGCE